MKHTHKKIALHIALFAALPSLLMVVLILTASGVTRYEAIGATVRLTALNNVASGNMPTRNAAPAVLPATKSASSRSRVKRIAPALQTATPPSAADVLPEKKTIHVPVAGERTVDMSGGDVPYNFEKHARDTATPDVIFRMNADRTTIDMAVFEDPNFKRNDARLSYSNGAFGDVTRDICFDAVRQMTMNVMSVSVFNTLCVETAEKRLIKIDLHPSSPLTVRYIVLDERASPPVMPSEPEAAEGVIELLGNATYYDPTRGIYSNGASALFLEKWNDEGGGGPRIEVNIPETMSLSSTFKDSGNVTEKNCRQADDYAKKIGSKYQSSFLREKSDSVLCVRLPDGRFIAFSDGDTAIGRVRIQFLRMDKDRGPGTGGFSLDQWEKEHPTSPSPAYVDFSHRTGRDNDGPFDMSFSGDSRTLRFEAAWNSGKPETAFVFPWTAYSQTTADVCTKAFADGFGSQKIAIGDVDAAVCFRTGDGYVGKMKRSGSAERAISFELWKKTVKLPTAAVPTYVEDGSRSITISAEKFLSYDASIDAVSAQESDVRKYDVVFFADKGTQFLIVASGSDGSIRLAETNEGNKPTYEACRKALTIKAIDPYSASINLMDTKTYGCFETMDGWVGAIVLSPFTAGDKSMTGTLYTWRKPSAPATPGIVREKSQTKAASLSPLNKTIMLNIFRRGEKGDKGNEYKYNGTSVLLRLQPDGTIDQQVTKERCNRVFKRGWQKKCWNETTTIQVNAFTLSAFSPLEKLVPVTGITYDALTQETCRDLVKKQQTVVTKIEKVSADTVACIAEPGGRFGKVGKFNGSTMTVFLW